jgi:preprotein translocase subunit Sec61beta
MEKIRTGPKDFFLWAGAMLALYVSVFSFSALFFNYIDIAFPDALNSYVDPYSSAIRLAMAALVVLFPAYLVLVHFIRHDTIQNPAKRGLWVRRWALVLTIFVAGVTVAIDLVTLINTYLGGEITTHFLLKVLIILLVMSAGLMHFLADLWGYWDINPRYALSVGIGVSVLVVMTVLSGFLIIGTPGQIRLYRFDDQKVSDLQNIQSEIVSYWQSDGMLPAKLSDLNDSLGGFSVPTDPQTGRAYEYLIVAGQTNVGTSTGKLRLTSQPTSFQLCATFNAATQPNSPTFSSVPAMPVAGGAIGQDLASDSWFHISGRSCFFRTIDPKRYPPVTKPAETK